ncbi:hypothetical protein OC845_006730 [Tilletia horrida]|nr:hypothetical protein OC845_006730 [Tilletia horrida]
MSAHPGIGILDPPSYSAPSPHVAHSYSSAEVDSIDAFCAALPASNLSAIVRTYIDDVEWYHDIVDRDSVQHRFMPDLIHRLFDSRSQIPGNAHRWAKQLRSGDMARLCLLGAMVLCGIQATGEIFLKLRLGLTAPGVAACSESGSVGPSTIYSGYVSHTSFDAGTSHYNHLGRSAVTTPVTQSHGTGAVRADAASSGFDSDNPAATKQSRVAQNSVNDDNIAVLEARSRHLMQLALAVEGPSIDLLKAQIIYAYFVTNEAQRDQKLVFRMLGDSSKMAINLCLHKDPGSLLISNEEKEDRRRLFYNLYYLDRCTSNYFDRKPVIPEAGVETRFPQERLVVDGKEQLHTLALLRAKLAKIITRIGSSKIERSVNGATVAELELEFQKLIQSTEGTPFHQSIPQIPQELCKFPTLDRQRHLFLFDYHAAREELHRQAFFAGPRISPEQANLSREACAQSAVALLETQRSLRLRINTTCDYCCFSIPFCTLEPAITLVICTILTLQQASSQERSVKKAKVMYYLQWVQYALDILRSIVIAGRRAHLLSRVLHKAVAIVDYYFNPRTADRQNVDPLILPSTYKRDQATANSMAAVEAWMQQLFLDDRGSAMDGADTTSAGRLRTLASTDATTTQPFLEHLPEENAAQKYQDAPDSAVANVDVCGCTVNREPVNPNQQDPLFTSSTAVADAMKSIEWVLAPQNHQQHLPEEFFTDASSALPAPAPAPAPALDEPVAFNGFITAAFRTASNDHVAAVPALGFQDDLALPGLQPHLSRSDLMHAPTSATAIANASASSAPQYDFGIENGPRISDMGFGFLDALFESGRHQFGSFGTIEDHHTNGNQAIIGATSTQDERLPSASTLPADTAAAPYVDLMRTGSAGLEGFMNEYLAALQSASSQLD